MTNKPWDITHHGSAQILKLTDGALEDARLRLEKCNVRLRWDMSYLSPWEQEEPTLKEHSARINPIIYALKKPLCCIGLSHRRWYGIDKEPSICRTQEDANKTVLEASIFCPNACYWTLNEMENHYTPDEGKNAAYMCAVALQQEHLSWDYIENESIWNDAFSNLIPGYRVAVDHHAYWRFNKTPDERATELLQLERAYDNADVPVYHFEANLFGDGFWESTFKPDRFWVGHQLYWCNYWHGVHKLFSSKPYSGLINNDGKHSWLFDMVEHGYNWAYRALVDGVYDEMIADCAGGE